MMKRITQSTIIILFCAIGLWSCVSDEKEEYGNSSIRFSLNVENYDDQVPSRGITQGTIDGTQITQLVTAVYNNEGILQQNVHTVTSADNNFVSVEGLRDGTYKVTFMGLGAVFSDKSPVITPPINITDNWLDISNDNNPCLDEYFYAEQEIVVTNGSIASQPTITMKRIVGLVEIVPIIDNGQFPLGTIRSVSISFDEGGLYSGHSPLGKCTGSTQFTNYTLNDSRQFYSLPSQNESKVTGKVNIVGERYNGGEYNVEYRFELPIYRNKKTIIRPHYDIDGDQYGTIRLFDVERNASNSKLFFQDGDSYKSIFTRSFYPAQPLFVSFDSERKNAIISHYASIGVENVTILAKRKNDKEYFELAWIESMKPFEERTVKLATKQIFRTESGGAVKISNLGMDPLHFKYRSESVFLQKINKITWPIKMEFVQNADTVTFFNKDPLPVRPIHARCAVELFTNMGYVLSNGWKEDMLESEKKTPWLDGTRVVSIADEVFPKIWEPKPIIDHLVFSLINHQQRPNIYGFAYVGNGNLYQVQQHILFNAERSGVFSMATTYHEYGHVLGYNHEGNLTYGEMQSVSFNLHRNLYNAGATPYTENRLHPENSPDGYKIVDGKIQ